jgi:hypothetical protein
MTGGPMEARCKLRQGKAIFLSPNQMSAVDRGLHSPRGEAVRMRLRVVMERVRLATSVLSLAIFASFLVPRYVFGGSHQNSSPLLPVPGKDSSSWHQGIYRFTDWPDVRSLPEVTDWRHRTPYCLKANLNMLMNTNALWTGWETNVVRASKWLPGSRDIALDAYLYRQQDKAGLLHICDTRPITVIAYRLGSGSPANAAPGVVLADFTSRFLTVSIPATIALRHDATSGFDRANGIVELEGQTGAIFSPEPSRPGPGRPSFRVFFAVARDLVVCEFRKLYVPAYDLDGSSPLFKGVGAPVTPCELAIEFFEQVAQPSPGDIPQIEATLAKLPTLRYDEGTDFRLIRLPMRAKVLGYMKLLAALDSVTAKDDIVRYVKGALVNRPSEPDLHELADRIQNVAIAKLEEAGTEEARAILRDISQSTKRPGEAETAMRSLIETLPEKKRQELCRAELERLLDNPDRQREVTLLILAAMQRELSTNDTAIVQMIMQKTEDHQISGMCSNSLERIFKRTDKMFPWWLNN